MDELGTTLGAELLVTLDRGRPEPLHRQLAEQLRGAIRAGRLTSQARMPSTRVLAADLGVSRRLVVEVYDQLIAEGFLLSRRGSSTRVARIEATGGFPPDGGPATPRYDIDFTAGTPDLSSFPRTAWLRALRQALAVTPSESFGYGAPQGVAATREALSDYLRRTRGVDADPDRIVLCSGVTQGIGLIAETLQRIDQLPVAVEDPGFRWHRRVLQHHHLEPIAIPVDDAGLDVRALADSAATVVLTTPAHQSPTGVVLTAERRAALVEWARSENLVIEDDYDAEYRYDRAPVGALQGITPNRVIYLGSVSKTLAPALRLGWILLPSDLVDAVTDVKALADMGNSVTDQIAFTQLMTSGAYDRHLRQMRRRYLSRRNALLSALARYLPHATVLGAAAGVQLTVHFPPGYDIEALVANAATMRVKLEPLARSYHEPASAPAGLILGYANQTESQLLAGVQTLARAAAV